MPTQQKQTLSFVFFYQSVFESLCMGRKKINAVWITKESFFFNDFERLMTHLSNYFSDEYFFQCHQTVWIGTVEVNQDTGLELGKCLSQLESGAPIHLHSPDRPLLTELEINLFSPH